MQEEEKCRNLGMESERKSNLNGKGRMSEITTPVN